MDAPPFVHLHCHSHYSLLDGASPIKKLVARAKELGMNGLALTDHGNLYGALEFYQACKAAGINPIVGYEAYIAPGSRRDKAGAGSSKEASYHLTLLAKNRTGFKNLIKLSSSAFLEGFYHKPRIDKEILADHSEGIVCLSGCVSGELSRKLLSGNSAEDALRDGEQTAAWFHKTFGDRYFLEIQNNGVEIQQRAMELTVDLANRMGLPLVATSDAHYVNQTDAEAQDVLLCINTGRFRTDTNRMKMEGDQFYLRSPEDMFAAMPEHADALARSQRIADSVDLDLELGARHFPTFTAPGNTEPDISESERYLRELVIAGLKERYNTPVDAERWLGGVPPCVGDSASESAGELSDEVMARVDRELGVINRLGFPD
ncbi:MAG: PHP domain-containing protein, partial [Planctomycetota bacterium]